MKRVHYGLGFAGVVATALVLGGRSNSATREPLLPFQGRLADATGLVVPDGARFVQFKMYDAPVGGTAVWAGEVHKLSVNEGLVSTMLGTKSSLAAVDFAAQVYLEITVDANGDGGITAADPPLLPRQAVVPAVYAVEAGNSRLVESIDLVADGKLDARVIGEGGIPISKIADDGGDPAAGLAANQLARGSVTSDEILDGTIVESDLTPGLQSRLDLGLIPPGTIVPFGSNVSKTPPGWLPCDGRAMDRQASNGEYDRLFDAIGTVWGDGTTGIGATPGVTEFNLPDLRGYFLRGISGGTARDPNRNERGPSKPGGNAGNNVGSVQSDQFQSHNHDSGSAKYLMRRGADTATTLDQFGATQANLGDSGNAEIRPRGGDETRPKNAYVNYIIKY